MIYLIQFQGGLKSAFKGWALLPCLVLPSSQDCQPHGGKRANNSNRTCASLVMPSRRESNIAPLEYTFSIQLGQFRMCAHHWINTVARGLPFTYCLDQCAEPPKDRGIQNISTAQRGESGAGVLSKQQYWDDQTPQHYEEPRNILSPPSLNLCFSLWLWFIVLSFLLQPVLFWFSQHTVENKAANSSDTFYYSLTTQKD